MTAYEMKRLIDLQDQKIIHPAKTIIEHSFTRIENKNRVYQKCIVGEDLIAKFPNCKYIKTVFLKRDSVEPEHIYREFENHKKIFNLCNSFHIPLCLGYANDTIVYEHIKSVCPTEHFNTIKAIDDLNEKIQQLESISLKLNKILNFIKSIHSKGYAINDNQCFKENCLFTNCNREFVIIDFEDMCKLTSQLQIHYDLESLFIWIKDVQAELEKVRRLPATPQD